MGGEPLAPVVLYGGTFDPIHRGHLAVANAVAEALEADVALLPAADPPHRPAPGASAEQRAAMVALAVADQPRLRLDDRELRRSGASYTIDTLAEVRAEIGPQRPLVWVLGADALAGLASWRDWEALSDYAHLLAFERAEHPLEDAALRAQAPAVAAHLLPRRCALAELRTAVAGGFAVLKPDRPLPQSASEVRRRLAAGLDLVDWVPPAVTAYIAAQGLYRAAGL